MNLFTYALGLQKPYDSGAWAYDDCEGDLTSEIIVSGVNNVLTGEPNTAFPVLYAIEDPPRNIPAQFRLRLVVIVDYIRPSMALQGAGYQFGRPQDKNYTPPTDYWWWTECRARYEEKYPLSQWYFDSDGNPLSSANDLPSPGEWVLDFETSGDGGIKEERAATPLIGIGQTGIRIQARSPLMTARVSIPEDGSGYNSVSADQTVRVGAWKREVVYGTARDLNGVLDDADQP